MLIVGLTGKDKKKEKRRIIHAVKNKNFRPLPVLGEPHVMEKSRRMEKEIRKEKKGPSGKKVVKTPSPALYARFSVDRGSCRGDVVTFGKKKNNNAGYPRGQKTAQLRDGIKNKLRGRQKALGEKDQNGVPQSDYYKKR